MTGRELIIYILENKLEDVEIPIPVPEVVTIEEAAKELDVGTNTIKSYCTLRTLDWIGIPDRQFIMKNDKYMQMLRTKRGCY